jgi:hypothetical protein
MPATGRPGGGGDRSAPGRTGTTVPASGGANGGTAAAGDGGSGAGDKGPDGDGGEATAAPAGHGGRPTAPWLQPYWVYVKPMELYNVIKQRHSLQVSVFLCARGAEGNGPPLRAPPIDENRGLLSLSRFTSPPSPQHTTQPLYLNRTLAYTAAATARRLRRAK